MPRSKSEHDASSFNKNFQGLGSQEIKKKTLIRDVGLHAAGLEHLENELARQICANEVLHEVVNPEIVPDSKP